MRKIYDNLAANEQSHVKKRRGELDLIRSRISFLSGHDKLMMIMYAEKGLNVEQISKIMGICRSTAARRIENISKRLICGEYFTVLQKRNLLTKWELDIAKDYFLKGLSIRAISKSKSVSKYTSLKAIRRIREIGDRV